MLKEILIKFRMFLLWCLLISFGCTVTCAVLMETLPRGNVSHFFKELHPIFGFAMTGFILLHLITRWRVFLPVKKAVGNKEP